jgi:protein-S-isoprenylcysteine O-methyltransferase Ste14
MAATRLSPPMEPEPMPRIELWARFLVAFVVSLLVVLVVAPESFNNWPPALPVFGAYLAMVSLIFFVTGFLARSLRNQRR